MRPSPSLSTLSEHWGLLTLELLEEELELEEEEPLVDSLLSWREEQPSSSGKSVKVLPSLSMPSWHCAGGSASLLSFALEQLKSKGKSVVPSLSLSMPSEHCGFPLVELEEEETEDMAEELEEEEAIEELLALEEEIDELEVEEELETEEEEDELQAAEFAWNLTKFQLAIGVSPGRAFVFQTMRGPLMFTL